MCTQSTPNIFGIESCVRKGRGPEETSTPVRTQRSPCKIDDQHTFTTVIGKKSNVLHSKRQLLLESRIILIRRQVDPIEAGVTLWKLRRIPRLLDREPPWSIRTLQVFEAVYRNTRSSRGKLQEARLSLGGPAPHTLPEPLDDLVRDFVPSVIGELGPIIAT